MAYEEIFNNVGVSIRRLINGVFNGYGGIGGA